MLYGPRKQKFTRCPVTSFVVMACNSVNQQRSEFPLLQNLLLNFVVIFISHYVTSSPDLTVFAR